MYNLTKCACIGAYFVHCDFFLLRILVIVVSLLVKFFLMIFSLHALLSVVPLDCVQHSELQCKAGRPSGALGGLLGRHYVPTGTEMLF